MKTTLGVRRFLSARVAGVVIGTLALGVAGTGITVAATGHALLLGRHNTAGATTQLSNTGHGPALSLTTHSSTTPPLAVSNSTVIPKLNASKVGGLSASQLQRATTKGCAAGSAIGSIAPTGVATCVSTTDFTHVVVVHPQSTPPLGGDALRAAVLSITDASASQPYLVYVEPGSYDLGGNELTLPDFVSLEGAGERSTSISTASSSDGDVTGIVAGNVTISQLSLRVESDGATASGLTTGILGANAPIEVDDVSIFTGTANELSYGIDTAPVIGEAGDVTVRNSSVSAFTPVASHDGDIRVWDSILIADGSATVSTLELAQIIGSEINAAPSAGQAFCSGDYTVTPTIAAVGC